MLKASVIFELSIKVKKNWHCLMYTSFKIWKLPTFTFFPEYFNTDAFAGKQI